MPQYLLLKLCSTQEEYKYLTSGTYKAFETSFKSDNFNTTTKSFRDYFRLINQWLSNQKRHL